MRGSLVTSKRLALRPVHDGLTVAVGAIAVGGWVWLLREGVIERLLWGPTEIVVLLLLLPLVFGTLLAVRIVGLCLPRDMNALDNTMIAMVVVATGLTFGLVGFVHFAIMGGDLTPAFQ